MQTQALIAEQKKYDLFQSKAKPQCANACRCEDTHFLSQIGWKMQALKHSARKIMNDSQQKKENLLRKTFKNKRENVIFWNNKDFKIR